jgi:hypothetical protein
VTYVTHARTAEELRAEILSDLKRRLDLLTVQRNVVARSAAEKSRIDRAISELEDMARFWTEVLINPKRTVKP